MNWIKPTVLELSTGMTNAEEWSFLPDRGRFYLGRTIQSDSHFAVIFVAKSGSNYELGDLLILNLVSREQFWMKTRTIANQMRTKVGDQNSVDLERRLLNEPCFSIQIGKDGMELKYRDHLFFDDRREDLGKVFRRQTLPVFGYTVYRISYIDIWIFQTKII